MSVRLANAHLTHLHMSVFSSLYVHWLLVCRCWKRGLPKDFFHVSQRGFHNVHWIEVLRKVDVNEAIDIDIVLCPT